MNHTAGALWVKENDSHFGELTASFCFKGF